MKAQKQRAFDRFWMMLITAALVVSSSISLASAAYADGTLCSGASFSTCIDRGYTAHAYENNYTNSYWKAYAGHNCTNYVGYMLTLNGDSGHGVAMGLAKDWNDTINTHPEWGYTMDAMPAVGSIAQWEANTGPATDSGHVAYVETVVKSGEVTTITISEDNFSSGPFSWKTISTGSTNWPSRFLHIKDVVNSEPSQAESNYLFVRAGGSLYGRASLNSAWGPALTTGAVDFKAAGTRVVIRDGAGNLATRDMTVGLWRTEPAPIDQYVVTPTLLVIRVGSTVYAKAGLGDAWGPPITTGAVDIQAAGNRIVIQDGAGNLATKEGVNGVWHNEPAPIDQYVITPNLLVVRVGGNVYAKAGLGDSWGPAITPGAVDIQAAGSRIVIRDGAGNIATIDTTVGTWRTEPAPIDQYVVTPDLLLVRVGPNVYAKAGLGDSWGPAINTGAVDVQAAGNRIVIRDGAGNIATKDTKIGAWYLDPAPITQYAVTTTH